MFTKTTILGRAGKDAEMRYTAQGKAVTNLSVAADIGYGDHKKTIWYRVTFWEKLAEVVNNYVSKGDTVFIEGELQPDENGNPRIWESNGEYRTSFELTGRTIKFLSNKKNDDPMWNDQESPF